MWAYEWNRDRFITAIGLAADLHGTQMRKGTHVPYLSHLLSVAALVAEDLGGEDEVLAALLHDAAEDQGGEATLHLIQDRLGEEVAALVRECSDSLLEAGEIKAPWRERKLSVIQSLPDHSTGALRVIAADKLHNTRSTVADLAAGDTGVWDRFKTGRDGFLWYHREVLAALQQLLPDSRSVRLLAIELDNLQS